MTEIDWIERFAEASSQHALIRTEGIRETLIPGKGMGMVADRVIGKGEIVMSSVPQFVEHDTIYTLDQNTLRELRDIAVERMGKEQQTTFLAQHRQWGGHHASDILITNSLLFKEFGGLPRGSTANFPEVSRFNHACRPNMGYSFDSETLTQSLMALRTIHPGDELTITYINNVQPRHDRVHALQDGWGFKCTCSHCSRPLAKIEQSDQRIERLLTILNNCDEESWAANDTQCDLDLAVESVLLHQEENLTGYPLAAAFYVVKLAAEAHGLQSLAMRYGQMAIDEQYGDRYEDTMEPKDRQGKNQETQDGTEERGRNQNGKDEAEDEGRPYEEFDLGSAQAVMHQVGEATINSPM